MREIRIKSAGNYLPFISGSRLPVLVTSLPVTSGDATSADVISGDVTIQHTIHHKCGLSCAYILLGFVLLYCEYPVLFFMSLFFLCSFSFGHCIVCPLIYGFWFHLWYLQTVLWSVVVMCVLSSLYSIFSRNLVHCVHGKSRPIQ
jgi:hypothetical protein